MMLHRHQRRLPTDHLSHFPRPQSAGVNHILGADNAFVGLHFPITVLGADGIDHRVLKHLCAVLFCRLGVSLHNAGRINVSIQRVIKRAQKAFFVNQRMHSLGFGKVYKFHVRITGAVFGALLNEIIKPLFGGSKINAAGAVKTDGLLCFLFQLRIKLKRVQLQSR